MAARAWLIAKYSARHQALLRILPERIGPILSIDTDQVGQLNDQHYDENNYLGMTICYWVQPRSGNVPLALPTQVVLILGTRPDSLEMSETIHWWGSESHVEPATWEGTGYLVLQYFFGTVPGNRTIRGDWGSFRVVDKSAEVGRQLVEPSGDLRNYLKSRGVLLPYEPAAWENDYESRDLKSR